MSARVQPCAIPAHSAIGSRVPGSHFHDSYQVMVANASTTAMGHVMRLGECTPAWVEAMMGLRNRVVRWLGLKNLGGLRGVDPHKPESAYVPGDRVGIFTLISQTPDEVLMGDNDNHLNVTVSVMRLTLDATGQRAIAVSTVVRVHNTLGHLYMLPVAPMHRRIVPAVLAGLAK